MADAPVVCVRFADGGDRVYSFFTHFTDLERGDLVVVDTRYGFRLAEVAFENPSAPLRKNATKWVVDRVDLSVHHMRSALLEGKEREQAP